MADLIRVLVVDDEERIRFTLKETLERIDYLVTTAADGQEALTFLRDTCFDVAIVDLNLGGHTDGIKVLEAIRWRWPDTAVLILTAHGSLESAIEAIREDVDDYLLKPARPGTVRQAVQRALKQRQQSGRTQSETRVLQRGSFFIDLDRHFVTVDGEPVDLTPQEMKLLVCLMQQAPKVVSPPDLVSAVRDYQADDLHEARQIIKWYIHRLRQRVEPDPSHPAHIINVRGVGYQFQE